MTRRTFYALTIAILLAVAQTFRPALAQTDVDWTKANADTLQHFSALVRFDTSAKERPAAEYIKKVLDDHGIPAQISASDPDRPNVVARIKGNGKKPAPPTKRRCARKGRSASASGRRSTSRIR